MLQLLLYITLIYSSNCYQYKSFNKLKYRTSFSKLFGKKENNAKLLQNPLPNSIGNFFESIDDSMSFIQCYMLSLGEIEGTQYGVGFPVDMPVMLSYFEDDELKPVRPDYPDYDHLVNHVSMQMDDNDFQLYKTPVVLTLQGEFEDEELNQIAEGIDDWGDEAFDKRFSSELNDIDEDDEGDNEDGNEITLKELLEIENIDEDYDDDDDEDDDEEEEWDDDDNYDGDNNNDDDSDLENSGSFWNSSPTGKMSVELASMEDYTLVGAGVGADASKGNDKEEIDEEYLVTDEDTKSLRKAHRRADRIIEYASDVKLIASFHYKKRNFHLIKLLEPIFIIGKRITDIKGYYFTLLEDEEAAEVTPQLESLITKQSNDRTKYSPLANNGNGKSRGRSNDKGRKDVSGGSSNDNGEDTIGSEDTRQNARDTARTSRRRWADRKKP